jgi:hypothetical protein
MRRHPKHTKTNPMSPRGWATDMRSGFICNAEDLIAQVEWRGLKLMPTGIRALERYIDKPQRQLGAIVISADPVGLQNARPEQYPIDEIWPRLTQNGQPRYLQRSECSRSLQATAYFNQGKF